MKKCEKCQIKVSDSEQNCPICGSVLTVTENDGSMHRDTLNEEVSSAAVSSSPFENAVNLSFTEKLEGFLSQKNIKLAVLFMAVYILYFAVTSFKNPIMLFLGVVPIALTACLFLLLSGVKKSSFKSRAETVFTVLYGISIAYVCLFALAFIGCIICGIALTLGSELIGKAAFIYGLEGYDKVLGISFIIGTVFSAGLMTPYLISLINITKSLKTGISKNLQYTIKGVKTFKVYTIIELVFAIFTSLVFFAAGDFTVIFTLLWSAAQLLIANALCEFDKTLRI